MDLKEAYNNLKRKKPEDIIRELEERGEVINCLSDRVFRSLFTNEKLKGILSYIIVYVTEFSEEEVYDNIDIVDSYEGVNNISQKESTHDLKVRINENTITLEMNQFNDIKNKFRNSAHYHESIVKKLKTSKSINDIGKVYQISFDAKRTLSDDLITTVMMMDVKNHLIDPSEANFKKYLINISKVKKLGYNVDELSRFEKILLMMRENKKEKLRKIARGDKELEQMEKEIEKLSKDPDMISYINYDTLDKIAHEIEIKNAEKEGHSSGYSEGHSSGVKDVAKKLLKKKMDIKDISDVTGLTKEEILKFIDK